MNPYKLREIYKYLTRAKKTQPDLPDVFPASKAPIPPKTQNVKEMEAINEFMLRNPRVEKAGGGRIKFDRGGLSDADVSEIKSKLPEGINIEYDTMGSGEGRWRYTTSIPQADGTKTRMRLPMLKAFDLEADKNLEKILEAKGKGKEVFDLSLKIGNKTILTPEKFYELRLKDSKLSLNKFLEKLTKKGFVKPNGKPFGSRSALHRLQQELGIADLVGGESNATRKRSLQDIKAIVRSAPNGPQILKSITDESQLRKIANALVSRDRLYERRGSFPVGRSKENKMWHNLWRASNTGNRIEIIGEFADGKLPIDNNGRVNWQMPNKDGVPAWKRVEFIDNQKNKAPLKWIDMPGSRSLGNQGQLRSQVDSIYGKGFFDRKMKPYDLQKQIGDLEIDLDGQKVKVGTILNENIVKSRLMDRLIKENKGAIPTEAEFNKRYNSYRNKLKLFNSMNVQHTKSVGLDPYTTELTTQSANAKERAIVQRYNTAIKKTTDSTELLKLSDNFANDINKLGGGIRSFDVQTGTVRGTKATPSSLATQLVSEARLPKETGEKVQAEILRKMGFKCKFAGSNGGAAKCDDPASYVDDINKTRSELNSSDVAVRAAANAKLNKGLQVAKTLPTIGKFLRRVGQATVGGVSKALQATGLGTPVGLAIEGMVEGGIYDYYRGQGYTHDQAYQETFFPGIITGREEGVPWYGGAESLLEKELVGDPQQNPKVLQYQQALKDQEQVFDAFGRKKQGLQASRKDIIDAASADIQDLNRSGTISRINRIMNPESMASQAYNTALETQAGRQDQRARDYKAENFVQTEPSDFTEQQLQKERNKAMLQMFPPPTVDTVRDAYTAAGYGDSLKFFSAQDYKDKIKDFDDYQKQSYFADNFRLEKAGGGIAKLAGVSSGPAPVKGPNPQGLLSLKNRVRNY